MSPYSTTRAEERARLSTTKALRSFIRRHGGSRKAAIARAATMPLTEAQRAGKL